MSTTISADIIIGAARASVGYFAYCTAYFRHLWAQRPAESVLSRARALVGIEPTRDGPLPGEVPGGPDGPLGLLLRGAVPGIAQLLAQCDADALSNGGRIVADGAVMDGAVLDRASLCGASLSCASLHGASLRGTLLNGAQLHGTAFNGARLNGARLDVATLDDASFCGATLDLATFNGAYLDNTTFDGASLVGAEFDVVSLCDVSLRGARFPRTYAHLLDGYQRAMCTLVD